LPWAGLRLGYEWQYTSARLSLDGSDVGGYAVSNLTVGTDLRTKGLQASVGAYNLFDKRYADPGSRFNWQNTIGQDGRSVRVKLVYGF
jgi:iron complex outermembrane receptor protein